MIADTGRTEIMQHEFCSPIARNIRGRELDKGTEAVQSHAAPQRSWDHKRIAVEDTVHTRRSFVEGDRVADLCFVERDHVRCGVNVQDVHQTCAFRHGVEIFAIGTETDLVWQVTTKRGGGNACDWTEPKPKATTGMHGSPTQYIALLRRRVKGTAIRCEREVRGLVYCSIGQQADA